MRPMIVITVVKMRPQPAAHLIRLLYGSTPPPPPLISKNVPRGLIHATFNQETPREQRPAWIYNNRMEIYVQKRM